MCMWSASLVIAVSPENGLFLSFLGGQTKYLKICICYKMFRNSAVELVDNLKF